MKSKLILLSAAFSALGAFAETLPFISTHPQSVVVAPGSNVTFTVASTNATAYQWRFNGTNIAWGTASTLLVTNAQANNSGYYVAIAKNTTGWTPSQMAYLSVVWSNGILPFYNTNVPNAQAGFPFWECISCTGVTNGSAQLLAGPALDQLKPVGTARPVRSGYFGPQTITRLVPTVVPGQTTYCRVDISYTLPCRGDAYTQISQTISLVAGGDTFVVPVPSTLRFPCNLEWPISSGIYGRTNRTGVVGEMVTLQAGYYSVSGQPLPVQWRKDGQNIPGATNNYSFPAAFLILTNLTAADAGNYDMVGPGANGITISKIVLGVQTTNGNGVFRSPRKIGSEFICDLDGAAGRNYTILQSSNLTTWTSNLTVSNITGTVTFSLPVIGNQSRYYRSTLAPEVSF